MTGNLKAAKEQEKEKLRWGGLPAASCRSAGMWLANRPLPTACPFCSHALTINPLILSRANERVCEGLFPTFGGYGVGPLTFSLILVCLAMAVYTKLGHDREVVSRFVLASPENANGTFLPEVRAGEIWRLFSPAFVHFGAVHLIFNLMWVYQLGSMIEARRGALTLALLVAATSARCGGRIAAWFAGGR